MTEPAASGDKHLLLQAAVDGELDAAGTLAFERAMRDDAALAAEYERLVALRAALRGIGKTPAPSDLRARIAALAAPDEPAATTSIRKPQTSKWRGGWRPAALAASLALVIGSGVTGLVMQQNVASDSTQILVASNVRGLISGQLADVASSDRHTVKPWFATRSVISPNVVDLPDQGFPLVGGRLDVIGATPVPTLVYRHGKHIISLTEVPEKIAHVPLGHSSRDGFALLAWRQGDETFVAISDAQPGELDIFAAAYHKATGAAP